MQQRAPSSDGFNLRVPVRCLFSAGQKCALCAQSCDTPPPLQDSVSVCHRYTGPSCIWVSLSD